MMNILMLSTISWLSSIRMLSVLLFKEKVKGDLKHKQPGILDVGQIILMRLHYLAYDGILTL